MVIYTREVIYKKKPPARRPAVANSVFGTSIFFLFDVFDCRFVVGTFALCSLAAVIDGFEDVGFFDFVCNGVKAIGHIIIFTFDYNSY